MAHRDDHLRRGLAFDRADRVGRATLRFGQKKARSDKARARRRPLAGDFAQIARAEAHQVEQRVEPLVVVEAHVRDLLQLGLGAEGDAETGGLEHANVVGAVADRDRLLDAEVEDLGHVLQDLSLALAVDDRCRARAR